MDRSSKVFVAGGTGMVGSAVIRRLVSSGHENIVASYHSRPPHDEPQKRPGGASWVRLDLGRQSDTEAFFEKERPEYVILAAAKVGGILANSTYTAQFIYDNITIAVNVIESCHRLGVRKLLNLGSSCIYPRMAPQPLKEEHLLTGPLEPTNEPYAIAKIAAIKLCRYFNEQYGTNYLSLMPTNLYGPQDNFNLETSHLLPALIRKFHLGRLLAARDYEGIAEDLGRAPLGFGLDGEMGADKRNVEAALEKAGITKTAVKVWGTGRPYREFLHVDDLAAGMLLMLARWDAADVGELVNIGSGEELSIGEAAGLVKEIIGFPGEIVFDAAKPDGMPRKRLDITRMARLGFRPSIGLKEGIAKTYEWYTEQTKAGRGTPK